MSFDKFRERFRRSKKPKRPVMDEEDYAAYLPSSSSKTVYNPIEKVRQYKLEKQGYKQFVDEDDDESEPANFGRTSKPKIIRIRKDGSVKGYAPPIPTHDNRPRKIRVRTDGTIKRRAPSPYKQPESDSDDLIDMHSQSSSSSSSSSEVENPFANWQKFD